MILALVLVAASVFFWIDSANASPADQGAATMSSRYRAVTKAADDETKAFLTVDYQNMDPLIDKVLAGATGSFKSQYSGARTNLKTSAGTAQAVSTGNVLATGVSDLDAKHAVVFVAANSSVRNKSTKGKSEPRYYRLKLTMTHEGGQWKTSDLEFVS